MTAQVAFDRKEAFLTFFESARWHCKIGPCWIQRLCSHGARALSALQHPRFVIQRDVEGNPPADRVDGPPCIPKDSTRKGSHLFSFALIYRISLHH